VTCDGAFADQGGNVVCTEALVNTDAFERPRGARGNVVKVLCLIAGCLLGSAVTFGQTLDQPSSSSTSTFRSGVDLVALNVVVTDGKSNFVNGLTADDFAVYEDGVQQDVSYFAAGEVPLDLAILLDTSASMTSKIATAQQAAIGFASTLRARDRLTVVDIKDATQILAPLSGDIEAAKRAILSTMPRGGTALYNGLYLTLKELTKQRRSNDDVRRQAIVVLSDGDDTASLMAFDDVMAVAKESGIAIYTIMLRSKSAVSATGSNARYFSQSEFGMKSLAQETGARAFFPLDITELAGVYTLIAEELASQYALGYLSKNPKRDGAYRRVIVRVSDRPGMQTRTRSGYLSARAERAAR
jgi:Ca-activated chloride channel homolog